MKPSLLITAGAFVVAGILHFVIPKLYVSIMPSWIPSWLPSPLMLVYISGVCEVLGAAGLLVPRTRTLAAAGLMLLLVAVFPANIEMLRLAQARGASPAFIAACWFRLPLQPLLIWWVWRVSQSANDLSR